MEVTDRMVILFLGTEEYEFVDHGKTFEEAIAQATEDRRHTNYGRVGMVIFKVEYLTSTIKDGMDWDSPEVTPITKFILEKR